MPITNKRKKVSYGLIIFSVILLFNTNIGIFDILPDTVAYIILARQLKRAAERAPFFAEACDAFKKLTVVTLLKYPASLLSALSGTDSGRGDMAALFAITFSAFEIVYAIKAIKYLFDGLYRLGERTDATALISAFKVGGDAYMAVDTLRFFTYATAVVKCVFQAIPDMFRLTRVADDGFTLITVSRGYPISVIATQFFGAIIGIFWLVIIIKYIKSIKKQGQFDDALEMIISDEDRLRLERKEKFDSLIAIFSMLAFSVFFTVEVRFFDSDAINLIPHAIFGIMLVSVAQKTWRALGSRLGAPLLTVSSLYTVLSVVTYVFEVKFIYYEGYDSLTETTDVPMSYLTVEILSAVEAVLLASFFVCLTVAFFEIIRKHTGTALGSPEYSHSDKKYHAALSRFSILYAIIGVLFSAFRCLTVFSYSAYTSQIIDRNEITEGAGVASDLIYVPVLEWANPVCSALCVALIGFTLYFTSTLRDEVKMKYSKDGDLDL